MKTSTKRKPITVPDQPATQPVKPSISASMSGNIFAVVGAACKALTRSGQRERAEELKKEIEGAKDYDNALQIVMGYVEFD